MTDLLTHIEEQPPEVLDAIARSMNVRAAEPAMQSIWARYMGEIVIRAADALEVGCGNGAATKLIMQHVKPATLVGVDPCSLFVNMASEAFKDEPRVSFALGDAASTGQPDASFDLVIAHTVYSHLVDPTSALTEAWRVLKPGGQLVIFDGDFATLTMRQHCRGIVGRQRALCLPATRSLDGATMLGSHSPFARTRSNPALTRSEMIARSNSTNTRM